MELGFTMTNVVQDESEDAVPINVCINVTRGILEREISVLISIDRDISEGRVESLDTKYNLGR